MWWYHHLYGKIHMWKQSSVKITNGNEIIT